MKSDKLPRGSFGLYPSFAAGILNSVKKNSLVCGEQWRVKLRKVYQKVYCRSRLMYSLYTWCYFKLSSGGKSISASFETKTIHGRLPSSLIFAQSVLKKIHLSSLAYGIVSTNKRVTYITNEVLTSKQDYLFEVYTCNLHLLHD